MNYQIIISGKGFCGYAHRVTSTNYPKLKKLTKSIDTEWEDVCKILGVEDYGETEELIWGQLPEDMELEVFLGDDLVWEAYGNWTFKNSATSSCWDDGKWIIIEEEQKGLIFDIPLQIDQPFDPDKLAAQYTHCLGGKLKLLTGINYGDETLYNEGGDTIAKGWHFHLS